MLIRAFVKESKFATIMLLALLAAACSGDGRSYAPTEPLAPAANLAGTWAGTVSITWEDGDSSAGPATATFTQNGSAVSGTLGPNQYRFEGTLEGNSLHGSIIFPEFTWPTFGQVAGDHLTMGAFNVRWDLRR